VYAGGMKTSLLRCCIAALALTTLAACSLVNPPHTIAVTTTAVLLETNWRLTRLGAQLIQNPVGTNAVQLTLQSNNGNVVGNAGCNRMFGRYALENDMLKFDGLGGTKMFCEARMELEERFLNALNSVLRWKITGTTLELFDETGTAVATFEASPRVGA
jgi:putative lipoprotein